MTKGNLDSFISIQLYKSLKTIKSGTTNMTLINIFETKYNNVLLNLDKLFADIQGGEFKLKCIQTCS